MDKEIEYIKKRESRIEAFVDVMGIPQTRDELIAWIRTFASQERESAGYKSACGDWVRIEDGLPEEGNWYLASCVRKDGTCADSVLELFYAESGWEDSDESGDIEDYWNVVAWMPMPEPFTEPLTDNSDQD